jgi:acetylornithine deacetylase/succinyl-diaminopimelate desuccinylase-like protein
MLRPVVASNGVVRWSIRTHGIAAHSSDPTRGRSAIRLMMRVMEALETRYIAQLNAAHPLTGPAQCSINIIRGGSVINIIPEECEIWLDRRVVPGENPDDVLPEVRRVLEELRRQVPDLNYSMTQPFIDWPLNPAGGEAFFPVVQGVLLGLGLSAELTGVGYGSDGSTLRVAGIPVVILGPGDIAQAHAAQEYLELDQLERAIDVYGALMRAGIGS